MAGKGRPFTKGKSGNPSGRPKVPDDIKAMIQLNQFELSRVLNHVAFMNVPDLKKMTKSTDAPAILVGAAKIAEKMSKGDLWSANLIFDRLIGRTREAEPRDVTPPIQIEAPKLKTFDEFCETAGYPKPFEKQNEMRSFAFDQTDPRLLLGARGYGKTDYLTILGVAYEIYKEWFLGLELTETNLIVTKSRERNSAIVGEISHALRANGVPLEKDNESCIRVEGLRGSNHSVSATTIKTKSFRGRHPKRILLDDPVTEDDVSPATRKHVEKVYNELHKLTSNILIIGQPAHKQDLYAKLRQIVLKMEVPHGTIPQLDHDLEAQRLAGVDEASIQASYFLKIPSDGSMPFENVRYIDKFPTGDSAVAFIDPSFKGGDFTALSIFKHHFDGVAVHGKVWKRAWNHCLDDMIIELKKYSVKRVGFETNSLGDQPIIMLRQGLAGLGVGVVGKDSTSNKHSRIMAAGGYAHLIHLSKESDKAYTDQVINYEYDADNDDAPDSLATGLEWIGLIRGKGKR